jgi:hypothetical protein
MPHRTTAANKRFAIVKLADLSEILIYRRNMVPPIGFEPTTPALRIMHKPDKSSAFIT